MAAGGVEQAGDTAGAGDEAHRDATRRQRGEERRGRHIGGRQRDIEAGFGQRLRRDGCGAQDVMGAEAIAGPRRGLFGGIDEEIVALRRRQHRQHGGREAAGRAGEFDDADAAVFRPVGHEAAQRFRRHAVIDEAEGGGVFHRFRHGDGREGFDLARQPAGQRAAGSAERDDFGAVAGIGQHQLTPQRFGIGVARVTRPGIERGFGRGTLQQMAIGATISIKAVSASIRSPARPASRASVAMVKGFSALERVRSACTA